MISAGEWTSELIGAWDAAQDLAADAVTLSHPKPGWAVLMFPDASGESSSGGARPRRFSRGYDSRASGFSGCNLQRVIAPVGDGGPGMFRHSDYLEEVGKPFVERCAHLY